MVVKLSQRTECKESLITMKKTDEIEGGIFTLTDLTLLSLANTEPPVMIVEPKNDIAMESYISEEIYLQCELSRSNGKVQWLKDGQEVEESDNVQLVSEGPYRRLVILNGAVEDGGVYVCETDGDSVFFQLTVKGKCSFT